MYVCVCNGITERQIESAVHSGGVARMRDLRNTLGVTADCACCAECALQCLRSALSNTPPCAKIGPGACAAQEPSRTHQTHSLELEAS